MRYFGGKARIGKTLAGVINEIGCSTYWEPFCGVFSVGKHVEASRTASDLHPDLILLLGAIRDGWTPPKSVSEEEYLVLKDAGPSALRAFAGFGCSNSGKFFGGYARQKGDRNFAQNAANSLAKLCPLIQGVRFNNKGYIEEHRHFDLIYCDPPYDKTTGFTVGGFDSQTFWDWVRERSEDSCVLVSEYEAPDDFAPIWQKAVRTDMNKSGGGKLARVEKLFRLI